MAGADLLLLPDDVGLAHVATAAWADRQRPLALGAGVRDVDEPVPTNWSRADVTAERFELPEFPAAFGIEAVNGAGAVEDQLLFAAGKLGASGGGPAIAFNGSLPEALTRL